MLHRIFSLPHSLPGWTARLLGRWYEGDPGMDISSLVALAGNTLVAAAVTDAWETARHGFARLFGRGKPDPAMERRLEATRSQLAAAPPLTWNRCRLIWRVSGRCG